MSKTRAAADRFPAGGWHPCERSGAVSPALRIHPGPPADPPRRKSRFLVQYKVLRCEGGIGAGAVVTFAVRPITAITA